MYEENEKHIDWYNIIKKSLIVIAIFLVILLIVVSVKKCSNNKVNNSKVVLTEQIKQMQNATIKYLNKDNLPKELNASKTIKLKTLSDKDLIKNLKDSDGNVCNLNNSYSEITKLENNYALKTYVTCGKNSDYKVTYIGCFSHCTNGEICEGDENSTNGVCEEHIIVEPTNQENKEEPVVNENNNNTTTQSNKTTTKTTKNNNQNNNKNNNQNNNNTNNNQTQKKVLYEFISCPNKCNFGYTYNTYLNVCEGLTEKKYYSTVINPYLKNEIETKYFNTTSELINSGYTYVGFVSGQGYKGTKTVTKYVATSCADPSYTYDPSEGKCVKTMLEKVYATPNKCTTTWSESTYLNGWTRTGNVKYE